VVTLKKYPDSEIVLCLILVSQIGVVYQTWSLFQWCNQNLSKVTKDGKIFQFKKTTRIYRSQRYWWSISEETLFAWM